MKSTLKRSAGRLGIGAALLLFTISSRAETTPAPPPAPPSLPAGQVFGRLPVAFEVNQGQAKPRVRFLAHGPGYALFLAADEAVLVLRDSRTTTGDKAKNDVWSQVVRMRFLGCADAPGLVGLDTLPGHSNYLVGDDPSKWRKRVPLYARVKYENLYPGVDAIFHGREGSLEYDLVLAPGSNPDVIRIAFQGTGRLRLDEGGNLILPVGTGEVVQHAPLIYQETGGAREMLAGKFVLRGPREIGFVVSGAYDPGRALGIALARVGIPHAPLPNDAFVARLSPDGSALVYSTYLGGGNEDVATAIAERAGAPCP